MTDSTKKTPRRKARRNVEYRLRLQGRPFHEVIRLLVEQALSTLVRTADPSKACSPTKSLRKLIERNEFLWMTPDERRALVPAALDHLYSELAIRQLLSSWLPLDEVAKAEGVAPETLRQQLVDPAIRRHYFWPRYSPLTGEIHFTAAQFDVIARSRLSPMPDEPPQTVLAPGWKASGPRP